MTPAPRIRFADLREHEGSQHRAWEELTFILTPDLDSLPAGTALLRHGTPDGGVEFTSPAPPGRGHGIWAWQAKYLFDFSAQAFNQMRRSLLDALESTQGLTRYTFILPVDRPAGAGGKSAMKKWDEHTARWVEAAAERGVQLVVAFHGHSDVLEALMRPAHAGAVRYFFDSTVLTPDSMAAQVRRAVDDLGNRYDPVLNVATDFPSLVGGVCLDTTFQRTVGQQLNAALAALRTAVRAVTHDLGQGIQTRCAVDDALARLEPAVRAATTMLQRGQTTDLGPLDTRLAECAAAVDADTRTIQDLAQQDRAAAATDRGPQTRAAGHARGGPTAAGPEGISQYVPAGRGASSPTRRAPDALASAEFAVASARDLLDSSVFHAAHRGALLVVGPAGCGKSHSLADVALDRTRDGAPTALVLGQNLTVNTSLGAELAESLQLGTDWNDLLPALQVAAQVTDKGRALLAIDAINEGPGADLWNTRIAGLLRQLQDFPMVAVVLTVRDSYEKALVPEQAASHVHPFTHPGLAGHEDEAIQLYAAYYHLSVPDVPALNPEFSNPLLLRSLCRAAHGRGLTSLPGTTVGQDWVFEGLIDAVNVQICGEDVLDRDEHDRVAHRAVRAIAEKMLDAGTEELSYDDARAACRTVHDDHGRASQALIVALEREGIVLREHAHRHPPSTQDAALPAADRIRFTYQRMSDHVRAQALLQRHPDASGLTAAITSIVGDRTWRHTGLLEALSVLVPRHHGRELLDLVCDEPWSRGGRYELATALLTSLPWRAPQTINEHTVELVRAHIKRGDIDNADWLAVLLSLACVPRHPLNVNLLHDRLAQWSLIDRDTAWSLPVLWLWVTDDNPVARTIDWLWGRRQTVDPQTADLAAVLMTWLLTCTSRRLRDSATKVLIELCDTRPDILRRLLTDFEDVNDPYVRERLLAVTLGHLTRLPIAVLGPKEREAVTSIHTAAITLAANPRHRPHVLVSHYVTQIQAETRRRMPNEDLPTWVEPPATWPLDPPSQAQVAAALGEPHERYFAHSPFGFDFGEYVLRRGVRKDFTAPGQRELRARRKRNAARRRRRAINALAATTGKTPATIEKILNERVLVTWWPRLRKLLESAEPQTEPRPSRLDKLRTDHPDLVRRAEQATRELTTDEPVRIEEGVLERCVISRALELGWTPATQGGPDQRFWPESRARGDQDKIETIGKKYSWIAYHELVTQLAQHCRVQRWHDAQDEPYESAWQISHSIDIDPTITLRGDAPPPQSSTGRLLARSRKLDRDHAWWVAGFTSPLSRVREAEDAWLRSAADLPNPTTTLTATDPDGHRWVVLESHIEWQQDRPGATRDHPPPRRDMWVRTQSYLTPATAEADIRAWCKDKDWMGLWMPTPPQYGLGYYWQYPHGTPWDPWVEQVLRERADEDHARAETDSGPYPATQGWQRTDARGFPPHPIALATLGRNTSVDSDMSGKDLPKALLPSPLLLNLLNAHHATADCPDLQRLQLGSVEREYSWTDSDGRLVMFSTDGWGSDAPTALFVRADTLAAALATRQLAWWTWVLGEKISWDQGEPGGDRLDLFGAAGLIGAEVALWSFDHQFRGYGARDDEDG